jgi:hypothetical protein
MSGATCSRSWRQAGRGDAPAGPRGSLVVRDAGDRSATRGGPLQGHRHQQATPGHCGPMHNDDSWAPQRSRPGTGRRSRAAPDRREPGLRRECVGGLFGRTSRAPQRPSDGAGLSGPSGGRRLPGLTAPGLAGRPSAPLGGWRKYAAARRRRTGGPAANWGSPATTNVPGDFPSSEDPGQDPGQAPVRTRPGSRCRPARRRSGRWPPGRTPAGHRASGWSRGCRRRPPARPPSCRRRCGCPCAGWATR